ncbi:MAG: glucosamine-6-phosphate deaminase [Alphaproteobacteria bacterium]|nr:glucosamine-6-phosphate deaminase [Alphaproteobacteria bacterium]
MRVIIKKDKTEVAEWAAYYVAYCIGLFHPSLDHHFVLGLPTGSTPLGMYKALISLYQKGKLSFKHVVTFNMDEYVGLPASHPQSYHFFMQENFFKHIDILAQNTHIPDGMCHDLVKECEAYEMAIKHSGGVHLFIGGVGEDGHIAFNEPFSSLQSRTRVKTLAASTIKANARFFNNDTTKVPTRALTVGLQTLMDAREVLILATGKQKAAALKLGIEGAISHACPLSVLQQHPHAIILCDEEAASLLEKSTIDYFFEVEKNFF